MLAVAALVFPAAASRADDAPTLSVQLTDLQATGTTPDSVVIVSGTVRNDGTVTARQASVSLWRSTARLRSAAVVTEALARSESPRGSVVSGEPGQRVDVIRSGGALAPQESRSFTLRSTLRGLELTALDASYWIGVDASASAAASGPVITAGSTRSLLTLPERPVGVGSVILLTSRPRQIRENLFTDDTLVTELQSRLAPLVEAARTGEIEWAVDPSLYAEVSDMADGYRVVAGASTAQGPGSDVARQWLDAVDALPRSTGRQLLYGTPDLSGAARVGDPAVLDRALAAGKADPVPGLSTVVWTPHLDPATVTLAARADTPLLTTGTGVESPAAAHDGRLVLRATPLAGLTGQALPDGRVNRASALAALARVAGGQVRFVTTPGELATDRYARYAWMSTASAFQPSGTLPAYQPPESVEGQSVVTPTLARTLDALASDLVAYGRPHLGHRGARRRDGVQRGEPRVAAQHRRPHGVVGRRALALRRPRRGRGHCAGRRAASHHVVGYRRLPGHGHELVERPRDGGAGVRFGELGAAPRRALPAADHPPERQRNGDAAGQRGGERRRHGPHPCPDGESP